MTTINHDAEFRRRTIQAGRDDLAVAPPLPSAEDLAAPFVRGIIAMHDAFNLRAESMTFDLERAVDGFLGEGDPDYVVAATELVATVERVSVIVRCALRGCITGHHRDVPIDMDRIIRSLADSYYIESVLNRVTVDHLMYGDD